MEKVKPSLLWLLLVPFLMVGGVVAAFVVGIAGTLSIAEGMQRVPIGQTGKVTFEAAGETTVFFEQRGVMQASIPAGLKLEITPEAGGAPLKQSLSFGSFTYNANGVAGRNLANVNIPAPGRYIVTTTLPDGAPPVDASVALAGDPGSKLATTLLAAFALGGGGFLLGIITLIVVLVKRSRHQKRITQARYANFAPMPPPPGAMHR